MTDASPSSDAPLKATALTVSLTVKDVGRSATWYSDVVGFEITQRHERDGKLHGVRIEAGKVRLLLNQDNGARGWDRVTGEGFSFMLTTAQPVDDIAARIKAHGGSVVTEPADMPWGVRAFRMQDPDGYRFLISSEQK